MTMNEPTTIRPATPRMPAVPPPAPESDAWPRGANIVLGIWLFLSAFIWPHTESSGTNTWIIGLLIAIAGIITLYVPWVRWLNAVLAAWLFISTLVLPQLTAGTMWNNTIVAILVFLLSLVPGSLHPTTGRPTRTAHA
jgi:SPW repeat